MKNNEGQMGYLMNEIGNNHDEISCTIV